MNKYYRCNDCGKYFYGMSFSEIESDVLNFNEHFDSLSKAEQKSSYGGRRLSIEKFEKCFCGSHYTNFTKEETIPKRIEGSTISPIIMFDEMIKIKLKEKVEKL